MIKLDSFTDLRRARAHHQGLSDASQFRSAAAVVQRLCAMQAQEWPSAQLAFHARCRGLKRGDVIRARVLKREFVLTWSLRGTLHLTPARDIRWLLALCGPGAIRATGRRYQQLGLSEAIRERALEAIQTILSRDAALTRSELADELAAFGIPVAGQAIHHLARYAALRGVVCYGHERDGNLTFALLDEWLPASLAEATPADPAAELARRYLEAYAPATMADFARWSGLSASQARQAWAAIAEDCATVETPESRAQMLHAQLERLEGIPSLPHLRLLPRYDNYLLGFASRAFLVADAHAKKVHPGGGLIRATVIINGEAAANWNLELQRKRPRLTVAPYETLGAEDMNLLESEARRLEEFLGRSLDLRIESG